MNKDDLSGRAFYRNRCENAFVQMARAKGYQVTKRGWPDFICFKPTGEAIVVEVKPPGVGLKYEQMLVLTWLSGLGVECYISDGNTATPFSSPNAPATPTTGALRQRRYRERNVRKRNAGDVTLGDVTEKGEPLGGDRAFLFGQVTDLDDEERTGTPTTGKGSRGKPNVTEVTLGDAQFDAFREAYPKLTHRTNWGETRRRWNQLKTAEKAAVLVAVPNYAATRDVLRNGEAGAQSWLNRRSWEQHQEPELALPPMPKNGHKPDPQAGVQEWLARSRGAENIIEGEMA